MNKRKLKQTKQQRAFEAFAGLIGFIALSLGGAKILMGFFE